MPTTPRQAAQKIVRKGKGEPRTKVTKNPKTGRPATTPKTRPTVKADEESGEPIVEPASDRTSLDLDADHTETGQPEWQGDPEGDGTEDESTEERFQRAVLGR